MAVEAVNRSLVRLYGTEHSNNIDPRSYCLLRESLPHVIVHLIGEYVKEPNEYFIELVNLVRSAWALTKIEWKGRCQVAFMSKPLFIHFIFKNRFWSKDYEISSKKKPFAVWEQELLFGDPQEPANIKSWLFILVKTSQRAQVIEVNNKEVLRVTCNRTYYLKTKSAVVINPIGRPKPSRANYLLTHFSASLRYL